jgi:hypothetical protein
MRKYKLNTAKQISINISNKSTGTVINWRENSGMILLMIHTFLSGFFVIKFLFLAA